MNAREQMTSDGLAPEGIDHQPLKIGEFAELEDTFLLGEHMQLPVTRHRK